MVGRLSIELNDLVPQEENGSDCGDSAIQPWMTLPYSPSFRSIHQMGL